jgi:hypothetical protein
VIKTLSHALPSSGQVVASAMIRDNFSKLKAWFSSASRALLQSRLARAVRRRLKPHSSKKDEAAGAKASERAKPLMPRYVQPATMSHHSGVASGRHEAGLPQLLIAVLSGDLTSSRNQSFPMGGGMTQMRSCVSSAVTPTVVIRPFGARIILARSWAIA